MDDDEDGKQLLLLRIPPQIPNEPYSSRRPAHKRVLSGAVLLRVGHEGR